MTFALSLRHDAIQEANQTLSCFAVSGAAVSEPFITKLEQAAAPPSAPPRPALTTLTSPFSSEERPPPQAPSPVPPLSEPECTIGIYPTLLNLLEMVDVSDDEKDEKPVTPKFGLQLEGELNRTQFPFFLKKVQIWIR
jgi:hypothetical protein